MLGIGRPARALDQILTVHSPVLGLWAVLVRFVVTAATSLLALHLLGRAPFFPSYLTFLPNERYYGAEIYFLPAFGAGVWLLGSALVHLIVRCAGRPSDMDGILNVIGFGLLVVGPAVWLLDWSCIALGVEGRGWIAIPQAAIAGWQTALFALGFVRLLQVRWWAALVLAALVTGGVYIPLAMIFIR
jgi:hypothetical protein